MTDPKLDAYEQELEDGLTEEILAAPMDEEGQRVVEAIQQRAASQRKKKVTFTSTAATFETFKKKAKAMQMPYSTVLNALMELYNRGEIAICQGCPSDRKDEGEGLLSELKVKG